MIYGTCHNNTRLRNWASIYCSTESVFWTIFRRLFLGVQCSLVTEYLFTPAEISWSFERQARALKYHKEHFSGLSLKPCDILCYVTWSPSYFRRTTSQSISMQASSCHEETWGEIIWVDPININTTCKSCWEIKPTLWCFGNLLEFLFSI